VVQARPVWFSYAFPIAMFLSALQTFLALLIATTKNQETLARKLAWGQTITLIALAGVVVIWASGNSLSGSAIRQWLDVASSARHYAIGWVALWLASLALCGLVLRNPLSLPLRIILAFSAMALCWLLRWTLLIQVQTIPKFNAQFNPYTLPGGTDGWLAILGTFGLWIALIIIVREALNAIARRMQHG
jgi:tetrathionate reductase subunit C